MVFTITFDQFNASLLNKILISFKKNHVQLRLNIRLHSITERFF